MYAVWPDNITVGYMNEEIVVVTENDSWSAELGTLVKQARDENKLLLTPYHGLVFTPDGLCREVAKGRFRWGVVNWRLIDPEPDVRIDYS